jgi:hypothetical protein
LRDPYCRSDGIVVAAAGQLRNRQRKSRPDRVQLGPSGGTRCDAVTFAVLPARTSQPQPTNKLHAYPSSTLLPWKISATSLTASRSHVRLLKRPRKRKKTHPVRRERSPSPTDRRNKPFPAIGQAERSRTTSCRSSLSTESSPLRGQGYYSRRRRAPPTTSLRQHQPSLSINTPRTNFIISKGLPHLSQYCITISTGKFKSPYTVSSEVPPLRLVARSRSAD